MALDCLASRWSGGKPVQARHADMLRFERDGDTVLLVKPTTFMNDSGQAVRALLEKDRLTLDDLLVVYDDLDLALGRIRVRPQGSAGGHNGIKSIQQHLTQLIKRRPSLMAQPAASSLVPEPGGPAEPRPANIRPEPPPFPRIKIGLGRPPSGVDPIEFVLSTFTPDEITLVKPAIERASDAAESWLREGIETAMNRFNGAMPT